MADQHAVLCHGDDAGLLADHDGDGIGIFGNAKAGAVTGAHILAKIQIVGKRQHTARGFDAAILNDGSTIVQGRALVENGAQHFQIDRTVHRRAGAHDLRKVRVAFQHDQCTGLGLRKALCRIADGNDGAAPCTLQARIVVAAFDIEQLGGPLVGLAHALQSTADLRLEQHHQRQQAHLQQ